MKIDLMGMWSAAVAAVRRIPVWRLAKPLVKMAGQELVQRAGDELQARLRSQVDDRGDKAVVQLMAAYDKAQAALIAGVGLLPLLPADKKAELKQLIQDKGDAIQAGLADRIAADGPRAVDAAFDELQAHLIAAIGRL